MLLSKIFLLLFVYLCEKCNLLSFSMLIMHDKWSIDVSFASRSVFSQFQRNHPKEYISCFSNLEKIRKLLDDGKKLAEMEHHPSFFRHETKGIFRIGQSGIKGSKESRLYIYPCHREKMLYILGIGTKESQRSDLEQAKKTLKDLC